MNLTDLQPAAPETMNHKQLKALAKASRPWWKKKRFWALGVLAVIILGAAASGGGTDKDALPKGSDQFPTATTSAASAPAPTPVTAAPKAEVSDASTCDVTREALLTGSPSDVDASMRALMADKSADATAREYADYYLNRDRDNASLREMDVSLIRMSCS